MIYEVVKKIEKLPSNLKGNSLRSIKADKDGSQMIIVSDAYGPIKSAVENFRLMTNTDISFRMRGKSIDVTVMATDEIVPGNSDATTVRRHAKPHAALCNLMEFAKTISFNSEDATDVIEFCNKYIPFDGYSFIEMDMDQSRMRILLDSENKNTDNIMPALDEYNMGLVK